MLAVLFSENTVKFRKKSPWACIFQGFFRGAYIGRSLYTEGNLRFKIDWASLQLKGHLCL